MNTENDMKLPEGKTCADCAHHRRCVALFECPAGNTVCDWAPSRFRQRVVDLCAHGFPRPCSQCEMGATHGDAEERLLFASDVGRNQQHRLNELERIVKLLLGYVGHRGACASYTNEPCTCGFESAMRDPAIAYNNSGPVSAEKFKGQFGKLE